MCTSPTRELCVLLPWGRSQRACGASLSLHFPVCKEASIVASAPETGRGLEAMTSVTPLQDPSVLVTATFLGCSLQLLGDNTLPSGQLVGQLSGP